MSCTMKVKTVTTIFSVPTYYVLRLKQFIFIIPNFYFNAKRESPRKQTEEAVQQAYWGGLLRTNTCETDRNRVGRTKTLTKTQLQQRPQLTQSEVWKLDEPSDLSWTGARKLFLWISARTSHWIQASLEREPYLGGDSSLGRRNSTGSCHQSLLQAAGGGAGCLIPGGGVWGLYHMYVEDMWCISI